MSRHCVVVGKPEGASSFERTRIEPGLTPFSSRSSNGPDFEPAALGSSAGLDRNKGCNGMRGLASGMAGFRGFEVRWSLAK